MNDKSDDTPLEPEPNPMMAMDPFMMGAPEAGQVATAGQALAEGQQAATQDEVIAALRTCYDPEIPVNIYDIGLIYGIHMSESGDVSLDMTLTSPACPVAGTLPQEVCDTVAAVDGVGEVDVNLTWEPPWDPSKMSEDAKMLLDIGF